MACRNHTGSSGGLTLALFWLGLMVGLHAATTGLGFVALAVLWVKL